MLLLFARVVRALADILASRGSLVVLPGFFACSIVLNGLSGSADLCTVLCISAVDILRASLAFCWALAVIALAAVESTVFFAFAAGFARSVLLFEV